MQKPCSLDNYVITCPWDKFLSTPLNLNLLVILGLRANYLPNFVYFL